MTQYTAHTFAYLDEKVPEHDVCVVHKNLWNEWMREETTDVILVKITYDNKEQYLHVYSHHSDDSSIIYIPRWCFGVEGIEVTMERVLEMPPNATKIILQPLDTELYHCDIATAVSEYLSNWHVLSQGTTITVPCAELGGFLVDVFVKEVEPSSVVLLRGEVPMELAEPLENVVEWERPPTPYPPVPQELEPFDEIPEIAPKGFVPFSGKGYSLKN
jgi:hypothetical protein